MYTYVSVQKNKLLNSPPLKTEKNLTSKNNFAFSRPNNLLEIGFKMTVKKLLRLI